MWGKVCPGMCRTNKGIGFHFIYAIGILPYHRVLEIDSTKILETKLQVEEAKNSLKSIEIWVKEI
jgi:hypothetical protein